MVSLCRRTSLALVVTMCPIVGFAEDLPVDAVASEDVQAALLPVSDSEVDVPDDALSVSSNILLDGASVSDEEVPMRMLRPVYCLFG